MNNCKACNGTGLQWMGDFSIGTEYQDTCCICNGKSGSSWNAFDIDKTKPDKLSDWEITSIIWNIIYPDRRRFKDLEKDTQLEWERIITMAIDLSIMNNSNSKLLRKINADTLTYLLKP